MFLLYYFQILQVSSVQNWEKDEVLFISNLQPSFNKQCFQQELKTNSWCLIFSQKKTIHPCQGSLGWKWEHAGSRTAGLGHQQCMQHLYHAVPNSKETKSGSLSLYLRKTVSCCKHPPPTEFCKINKITLKFWKQIHETRPSCFLFLHTTTVSSEEVWAWLTVLFLFSDKIHFSKRVWYPSLYRATTQHMIIKKLGF